MTQRDDEQRLNAGEADQRDRFLDVAAHELRTPITSLKGHIQLLQRRMGKQQGRDTDLAELGKMMYQVERLNHYIDIFLGVTHLTQSRFEINPTVYDLRVEVQRIVDLLNTGASGTTITFECDGDPIFGEWDRRRMNEALMALLTNALKFAPNDDLVLRLKRDEGLARVEIADHGPGVPEGEHDRIFELYGTGSNVKNPGVGLGLYVASESVKRHHGEIGVRSRPGGGSIFWFEVPLKQSLD